MFFWKKLYFLDVSIFTCMYLYIFITIKIFFLSKTNLSFFHPPSPLARYTGFFFTYPLFLKLLSKIHSTSRKRVLKKMLASLRFTQKYDFKLRKSVQRYTLTNTNYQSRISALYWMSEREKCLNWVFWIYSF